MSSASHTEDVSLQKNPKSSMVSGESSSVNICIICTLPGVKVLLRKTRTRTWPHEGQIPCCSKERGAPSRSGNTSGSSSVNKGQFYTVNKKLFQGYVCIFANSFALFNPVDQGATWPVGRGPHPASSSPTVACERLC